MQENNKNWREFTPGEWLAMIAEVFMVCLVVAFFTPHTLNAFEFIFPVEQSNYRMLGLGLTSGALVVYVLIVKFAKRDSLNRTVAIVMLGVSVIAELVVAGFGMQIEAFKKANFVLTPEDVVLMVRVFQVLGLLHALALLCSIVGAEILDAFSGIGAFFKGDKSKSVIQTAPSTPLVKDFSAIPPEILERGSHEKINFSENGASSVVEK